MEDTNRADDLFIEADKLISQENIVEGKDMLLDILSDFPDYGRAHNHLAWIYHYKIQDYEKSEYHYKLALKYSKNYHAPYNNYSYLLVDMNKYDEMIQFGKASLKVKNIDKAVIYNLMARSYELKSELDQAYKLYKQAKVYSIAANFLQEVNASLQRVQNKMNVIQKIKILFN